MKWLRRIIFVLAAVYLALCALLFVTQSSTLFPGPNTYFTPSEVGADFMSEVNVETSEGRVMAWWVPPSSPDGDIVMVFHGNGSAVYSNTDIFRDLADAGHGVWSVGYIGYPASDGKPSEAVIVAAARDQLRLVQRDHVGERDIVYYGTSIGSGVAAQLARTDPPDLLILDAPFNSLLDMAQRSLGMFPVRFLLRHPFRSDEALAEIDVPLLWIHGTADRVVPIEEGRKLFESYLGPKRSLVIEGANHVNTWPLGGREFVLEALS